MNHTKAVIYGGCLWAFVFITATLILPFRVDDRPLFESIMPLALTFATTLASVRYFRSVTNHYPYIGLCLGIIWMITSLLLDSLIFSWGPMKMTIVNYIKDIGITYGIIFTIPIGIGYALQYKSYKKGGDTYERK